LKLLLQRTLVHVVDEVVGSRAELNLLDWLDSLEQLLIAIAGAGSSHGRADDRKAGNERSRETHGEQDKSID
jgi:hypothetical protein